MILHVSCLQVLWKYSGEIQPLKLLARDTTSIGQNITTKAIGKMEHEVTSINIKYVNCDLMKVLQCEITFHIKRLLNLTLPFYFVRHVIMLT